MRLQGNVRSDSSPTQSLRGGGVGQTC